MPSKIIRYNKRIDFKFTLKLCKMKNFDRNYQQFVKKKKNKILLKNK